MLYTYQPSARDTLHCRRHSQPLRQKLCMHSVRVLPFTDHQTLWGVMPVCAFLSHIPSRPNNISTAIPAPPPRPRVGPRNLATSQAPSAPIKGRARFATKRRFVTACASGRERLRLQQRQPQRATRLYHAARKQTASRDTNVLIRMERSVRIGIEIAREFVYENREERNR